jgi:RHS repeat-associated protein
MRTRIGFIDTSRAAIPAARVLVFACATAWAAPVGAPAAQGADETQGACHASRLGQPCPVGDTAAQGAPAPALNLGAGNPIHLVTGNKYQREVDLAGPAAHAGLEIVRHYNAMDPRAGTLGRGWTLSYDTRLHARAAPGRVQIAQADGSRMDFRCDAPVVDAHGAASDRRKYARTGDGADTKRAAIPCAPLAHARGSLHREDDGWRWRWPGGRALHFDEAGRLTRMDDAGGRGLRIIRDARPGPTAGEITEVIDERGNTLRFSYELAPAGARLARIDTPLGAYTYTHDVPPVDGSAHRLRGVAHPAGWRREYAYEPALQSGDPYRLTGITWRMQEGAEPVRTHSWAYDASGRAILSVHGAPEDSRDRVEIGYLAAPSPDGADGLTRVRAAAGATDFHTALRAGRMVLLSVEGAGCPGCAAPGLHADYDAGGRLTRLNGLHLARHENGAVASLRDSDGGWPGLSLSFDPQGRLAAWSSAATGKETWRRDAAGRLAERRYANGDVWRYTYDEAGRPVEIIARAMAGALRTSIGWRGGQPARIDHPHESETRRYDSQGRLVARSVHRPALDAATIAYGYDEGYAWDAHDRLVRHALPEGGSLTYAYEASGRLARIAWEYGGDTRELLRAAPGGGYLHGNGLRTRGLLRPGGLDALAVDDPSAPDDPPIFLQRPSYDRVGRIAREVLRVGDWRVAHDYGYDDEGRLAQATAAPLGAIAVKTHEWRYAWHRAGDALAMQDDAGTRTPLARRDASGLPVEHDGMRLRYGADRRLQSVSRGRTELARYVHNAYGERIRRTGSVGATESYLYTGNRLTAVARPLAAGGVGVAQRYVYAGWVPVAIIAYPQPRPLPHAFPRPSSRSRHPHRRAWTHAGPRLPAPAFYAVHADAIGQPHAVTDAARRVRWRALWSPAGAAFAVDGDVSMPLRQPGHVYDPATGWHDNYLRTYDPRAGHYLEPDPAGPMADTQPYGYADQQPRRHIDPFGLLLFAFDGTSRDRDARSNVALMSGWYADGSTHYHRGPGFASPRLWDAATAGSAHDIVDAQWNALLRDMAAGRERRPHAAPACCPPAGRVPIDLIGYSRGAALAMHFSNRIADHYRAGRFWARDPVMGTVTACADLRFMGLFDTVAQFGVLGDDNRHYNLAVAAEWRWVAHAVALNERRWLFPLSATPDGARNVITAPFIGAHGDIGGGYLIEPQDAESARPGGDLSDVALAWMLKQAGHAGAAFHTPPEAFQRVDNPVMHDERSARDRHPSRDRPVLDGAGDRLMDAQGQHPDHGDRTRAEVEAFIRRVDNWTRRDDLAVGTVDMDGYRRWLKRTLGLYLTP